MSDGPLRIFVGTTTADRDTGAEMTLRYSAEKHSSLPIEWTWMRAWDPELPQWTGWKNQPMTPAEIKQSIGKWGTPFSLFRWAIPELCSFQGTAIYMDVDMLVLDDLAPLWQSNCPFAVLTPSSGRSDIMLMKCGVFAGLSGWPDIADMRKDGQPRKWYEQFLRSRDLYGNVLGEEWDTCDAHKRGAKVLHYTSMQYQPHRPHPSRFNYSVFCPKADTLWKQYNAEAQVLGNRP